MKTIFETYRVGDLVNGFTWSEKDHKGLYGLSGNLTIQPAYQRNYLYGDGKRDAAVIESVLNGHPLGLMYFVETDDGRLEVLDGQQRITSLGRFARDMLSVPVGSGERLFSSLNAHEQQIFLDHEILVYRCTGDEKEIKDWFQTINIAGIPLNEQELLNAVYSGPFVTAARNVFSNRSNSKMEKWGDYVKGTCDRQDYLATALQWVSAGAVTQYLATRRSGTDVTEMVNHFETVIEWARVTFPKVYPQMQGLKWGDLYLTYHKNGYDPQAVADRVAVLFADPLVENKRGIFEYVLSGDTETRLLNIRVFDQKTKHEAYRRQTDEAVANGESNCGLCSLGGNKTRNSRIFEFKEMEADHVTAWILGGDSSADNCEMLCVTHNRAKGAR